MDLPVTRPATGRIRPGWVLAFLVLGVAAVMHAAQCAPTILNLISPPAATHALPTVVQPTLDISQAESDATSGDEARSMTDRLEADPRLVVRADPHSGVGSAATGAAVACLLMLILSVVALTIPDSRQKGLGGTAPSPSGSNAPSNPPAISMSSPLVLRT